MQHTSEVARIPSDRLNKLDVTYELGDGREIALNGGMVMRYLVQGRWELIEESELVYFLKTCQALQLDPFLRECYLIKYSSKQNAAIVVAAQTFRDRAVQHPLCTGWEKGLVLYQQEAKEIIKTDGIMLPDHKLIGAWFATTPKGWTSPYKHEVNLDGYIQRTNKGDITRFWQEKNQPTQIMKVVEAQGLRQVYGTSLRGLYVAAEVLREEDDVPKVALPDAETAKTETARVSKRSSDFTMYDDKNGQAVEPAAGRAETSAPTDEPPVQPQAPAPAEEVDSAKERWTCGGCGLAYSFQTLPAYLDDKRGDICDDCLAEEQKVNQPTGPNQAWAEDEPPVPEEPPAEFDSGGYAEAKGRRKETPEEQRKRLETEAATEDVSQQETAEATMELELFADIGTQLKTAKLDERLVAGFQTHLKSVSKVTKRPLGQVLADTASDPWPMFDGFATRLKGRNYLGWTDQQRTILMKLLPKQDPKAEHYDPCRWANFSLLKGGLANHINRNVRAFLLEENEIPAALARKKWSNVSELAQQPFPLDKYKKEAKGQTDATTEQLQRMMAQMKAEEPGMFKAAIKNQGLTGKMFSEFEKADFLNVIRDIDEQRALRDGGSGSDPSRSGF